MNRKSVHNITSKPGFRKIKYEEKKKVLVSVVILLSFGVIL